MYWGRRREASRKNLRPFASAARRSSIRSARSRCGWVTHFLMKRLPKVATEMALHVLLHYFLRSSGLAVSRAHAMKSCANGLSVRFFKVMIAVG